jgi:hypothetical protein
MDSTSYDCAALADIPDDVIALQLGDGQPSLVWAIKFYRWYRYHLGDQGPDMRDNRYGLD